MGFFAALAGVAGTATAAAGTVAAAAGTAATAAGTAAAAGGAAAAGAGAAATGAAATGAAAAGTAAAAAPAATAAVEGAAAAPAATAAPAAGGGGGGLPGMGGGGMSPIPEVPAAPAAGGASIPAEVPIELPPAVQEMLQPTPNSVMQGITGPQMTPTSANAGPSLGPSSNMSTASGPVHVPSGGPSITTPEFGVKGGKVGPAEGGSFSQLRSSIKDLLDDISRASSPKSGPGSRAATPRSTTISELLDTFSKASEVKSKLESLSSQQDVPRSDVGTFQDDPIPQTEPQQIPQLERAQTSELGLASGSNEDRSLSLEELQGMQQEGILKLISELRTQRRLFG